MFENVIIAKTLHQLAIRITTTDKLEGSGILYTPHNTPDLYFIITASHCLKGWDYKFNPPQESITLHFHNGNHYQLTLNDSIFYHPIEDIVVLLVARQAINAEIEVIPFIKLVTDNGGERSTVFY